MLAIVTDIKKRIDELIRRRIAIANNTIIQDKLYIYNILN